MVCFKLQNPCVWNNQAKAGIIKKAITLRRKGGHCSRSKLTNVSGKYSLALARSLPCFTDKASLLLLLCIKTVLDTIKTHNKILISITNLKLGGFKFSIKTKVFENTFKTKCDTPYMISAWAKKWWPTCLRLILAHTMAAQGLLTELLRSQIYHN